MIYHTTDGSMYGVDSAYGSFRDLKSAVLRAIRTCEGRKFDTIAVQGVSGMSLGFPLALALDVDIVVVRKPGEECHDKPGLIGDVEGKRCLFVDDFVSGGSTRSRVRHAVEKGCGQLVAEYTSRDDSYRKL